MRLVEHRGKWAVRAGGRRLSTGVEHRPDTRAEAARAARLILEKRAKAGAGETCAEIVAAYFLDMPNRANPKAVSGPSKAQAAIALAFFGAFRPADVTREACRSYIAQRRAEGKADGTIARELSIVKAALRWADPRTPAVFEQPSPGRPRERFLTREEVDALRAAAASSPHIALFIELAVATAGRREAILGLTWSTHIDFGGEDQETGGSVWLGFKRGGKGRARVPMTRRLRAALLAARAVSTSDHVVEFGGRPVGDVKKGLRAAYDRAGLQDVPNPAHVLRHTAGAWMAMQGVPLDMIRQFMGHSSIRTTERHYVHLTPTYLSQAAAALE